MRGLAILCMMGYHGEVAWNRGAFLALSQFFTLSGFLITGVLLRNHAKPGGRMRTFWSRRMRRLMPAALVALAGIVVFGATVATADQARALPGDVASAATWTANWHFILSGRSYFNLFAAPSPVQHFWSLAIEEQFYLILPVLMVVVIRRTGSRRVLFAVIATAALLSTAWMAALYQRGASLDRLYYGTDTRMAELLVGAALAVVIARTGVAFAERTRHWLGAVGLVCFTVTIWCWINVPLSDGLMWRGGFLAYSLVSCGVIVGILAGTAPLTTVLSLRPIVFVGRISYGLYLYHFPIFLWLDEARTGLAGWQLLALRFGVTFSAAIVSYRWMEQPIMRGASLGLRRRVLAFAIPAGLAVVIVAAVVTVRTPDSDPLATLRAGATPVSAPAAADGVLDLLVVPGRADDPVVAQLVANVDKRSDMRITVAPPLECAGGLVRSGVGRTCKNWAERWPKLVERADPDAVLVYADDWSGPTVAPFDARPADAATAQAAATVLAPAIDILGARGAPVIWASSGTDFATALRRTTRPFDRGMSRLQATRTDIVRATANSYLDPAQLGPDEYAARSVAALLSEVTLHRRAADAGLSRVMVVGDSQSLSLGYGLERWAADQRRALVWNRGNEGCGVAVDGDVRGFGSTDSGAARCRAAIRSWPKQLRSFRPDVVIVLSSLTDIQDRKIPGESRLRAFGDATFDRYLLDQYRRAVDVLSSTGATVVWMTPPCTSVHLAPGQTAAYDARHIGALGDRIVPALLRSRPGKVVEFDLAEVLCPNGKPLESVSGVGEVRPDGVHFSVEGAIWFARNFGNELLRRGGV